MTDVASLGLEVRSDQVTKGAKALDQLTNSAKRAEAAASGVSSSTKNAGTAASSLAASSGQVTTALNNEAIAAKRAAQAMTVRTAAVNDNVRRMGGSMSGLAAQWQDTFVTAAMDMNPVIIGLQQGTQVAGQMEMAMQGGASALDVLGQSFKSLFSPVTIISIALVALAAAGFQMVDWSSVASAALNRLADVLETIAPYAIGAAAALALLYAPAIIGGVASLVAGLWGLVRTLGAVALAFAAANPAVAFVMGTTAAVAAANIFRDELAQIFGRDIVADAKNAVNLVIGAFVGGFDAIKAAWGLLPPALGDLGYQAANKFIEAINWMVGETVSIINGLIAKINGGLRDAVSGVGGDASSAVQLPDLGSPQSFKIGGVSNPYAGSAGDAMAAARNAASGAMGQDYLGEFGEAISRGAGAASDKLRELATQLGIVDEKTKKGRTGRGGKTEEEKYADIVKGAERRIASLKAEQAAFGMTEEAALKLQYTQDLLNQAQRAGITLTAAQKAELAGLAGQMAQIEIATEKAREAMEFNKDLVKGFVSDLKQGLENGEGFWKSFANAALNALDKVIDKLLNDVIDALFEVNKAGSGSGGGGLFGWLGSLFGGGGASVDPWAGMRGYANGTASARAGVAMVGERGPELVRFRGGEQVVPNHKLAAANQNQPAAPQEVVLRVIGEEGPMFRPTIEAVSEGAAVRVVHANNEAQQNYRANGGR